VRRPLHSTKREERERYADLRERERRRSGRRTYLADVLRRAQRSHRSQCHRLRPQERKKTERETEEVAGLCKILLRIGMYVVSDRFEEIKDTALLSNCFSLLAAEAKEATLTARIRGD
jgi:hypothetical protein